MGNVIAFPGLGISMDPSNVAFSLFGMPIYWYGILIGLGFVLAATYTTWRLQTEGVDTDKFMDVILITAPLAIVCARLYYVVFNMSLYHSFQDVINIRNGGLAIYGGIIGGFAVGTLAAKWRKIPLKKGYDALSMGFLIGQCIGRWGNFFNREAHGGPTTMPWGMEITVDGVRQTVHPTFLYESLWNLIGFLLLNRYYKHKKFDGEIALLYVAWYGLGRFFIEGLRTDSLYLFQTGIRVSQLLAVLSCIAAITAWAVIRKRLKTASAAAQVAEQAPAAAVEEEKTADVQPTQEEPKSKEAGG